MSRRPALQTLRQLWWAPLLCYGLAWLIASTEAGREFEWHTLDWRTQLRSHHQAPPDQRVLLVLFDDDTELNLVSWPPPRNVHGQLIELMSVAGLRVATMDVFLTAERDAEGDAQMAAGVQAAGERGTAVVTGAVRSEFEVVGDERAAPGPTEPLARIEGDLTQVLSDKYAALPYQGLRAVSHFGFVDVEKETRDGIVRRVPLVVRIGQQIYPGLGLQTLLRYFDVPASAVHGRLGGELVLPTPTREIRIPMDERGCMLLNYRYEADARDGAIESVGYRALLLSLASRYVEPVAGTPPPPLLRGRVAVVGLFATGNADAGPSPLASYSPLPLVHANMINNVLADDFARPVPPLWVWGALLALGWGSVVASAARPVNLLITFTVVGAAGYGAVAFGAWIAASWWIPLAGPLLGFGLLQTILVARRILEEQAAKQAIKGMFGAYVSPQVVEQLVSAGQPPQLGGHEEELTAYFSDIQSFSTFSEQLPPSRLVELMNEYLTACTDILQEEGGTLDKYIGDAVVAMFGAPIAQPDHAYRACVAVCRAQRKLDELRAAWSAQGEHWPAIVRGMRMRIGLNTGRAVVGNMGSRSRFNYTMMGDDVNLAARMESGAKAWGAHQVCTEATRAACVRHGGERIVFRPLGRVIVVGREQAVPIFELTGFAPDLAPATQDCLAVFAEGLECFRRRQWDMAERALRRAAELEPLRPGRDPGVTTNPSLALLARVQAYRLTPPPPEWDGAVRMQEK